MLVKQGKHALEVVLQPLIQAEVEPYHQKKRNWLVSVQYQLDFSRNNTKHNKVKSDTNNKYK